MMHVRWTTFALAAALCASLASTGSSTARAQSYRDSLVQAPELGRPERGSISGTVGDLSYGASELSRGSYRLDGPFEAPVERGPMLASFLPSYSPDHGQSEWGMGWSGALVIERHRVLGDIDYETDDFTSPWGPLRQADDGAWYPLNFSARVRALQQDGDWIVRTEDGTRYLFSREDAVLRNGEGFRWYLSQAVDVFGDRTWIEYEENASGRRFPTRVYYASRLGEAQYRIDVEYETVDVPFADYRSGAALLLDRRVSALTLSARGAAADGGAEGADPTDPHVMRWRYDLAYQEAPAGTAFYLVEVTRTFASGASEPPITYEYAMAEEALATSSLESLTADGSFPGLAAYLDAAGGSAIQPDVVSFFDLGRDGLIDMEHRYSQRRIRHVGDDFVVEDLPADPTAHAWCRPSASNANDPRNLVRMFPGTDEPQVFEARRLGSRTGILVCNYTGTILYKQLVSGDWSLGPNTRLHDLDRNLRADVVKVTTGGYEVLRNVDDGEGGVLFEPAGGGALSPAFGPSSTWVQEMNGDGIPDLVGRFDQGVVVWYGLGDMRFREEGVTFRFHDRDGSELTELGSFQITFTDVNKDGPTDALLSRGRYIYLFTNRGTHFAEVVVPGFEEIDWNVGLPVAIDLEGRGEEQAVMVKDGEPHAVTLSKPESGLLVGVHDGKGGRVAFEYERARPTPGIVRRPSMLTRMVVSATGETTIAYDYDYEDPAYHSEGEFLLGYGIVVRRSPIALETVEFHHDDTARGLLTYSAVEDFRTPGVFRTKSRELEQTSYGALPWLRVSREATGWASDAGGAASDVSTEWSHWDGLCPVDVTRTNEHGSVRTQTVLAAPSSLDGAVHCTKHSETVAATHPGRGHLDVSFEVETPRNALGQVTEVVARGAGSEATVQSLSYDAHHRLESLRPASGGETRVTYDEVTGQVASVTTPDGVLREALNYGSVTGKLEDTLEDRGGAVLVTSFRYDGMERLARMWDSIGEDSGDSPAVQYGYHFATDSRPGAITRRLLVDGTNEAIHREVAELQSATGNLLAKAERSDVGWHFGSVTERDRTESRVTKLWRAPLDAAGDPLALEVRELLAESETTPLESTVTSTFEDELSTEVVVQENAEDGGTGPAVVRRLERSLEIDAGQVVLAEEENGLRTVRRVRDGVGRLLAISDASGATTRYEYDALGRIVGVTLPDGHTSQQVEYDGLGRPSVIRHGGIGALEYAYDDSRMLLASKTFSASDGSIVRTTALAYDAIGRVRTKTHEDPSTGRSKVYRFEYDGGEGEARVFGQRGWLTGVATAGYQRSIEYRPDGRERRIVHDIDGWREVAVDYEYFEDGSLRAVVRTVRDDAGNPLEEVRRENVRDAYGRLDQVKVDGDILFDLSYDAEGRVASVSVAGGDTIVPRYDTVTHRQRGFWHSGDDWSLGYERQYDERGLLQTETIEWAEGAAEPWQRDRTYTYDERRFLTSRTTEQGGEPAVAYDYDVNGRLTDVTDAGGARSIRRDGDLVAPGGVVYEYDAAGRIVRRGDLELTYGPDGHIAEARRGGRVWTFLYDEAGNRVAKLEANQPVAAYVAGGTLTASAFVEPLSVMERTVGVLVGGDYRSIATDPLGTVLAATDGRFREASPYGFRTEHSTIAQAIDYVAHGFDADLGVVRMGVRDYDPYLGQFLTPDPVFREDVERCAESPVECNLYTYAKNDPMAYVDPTGGQAVKKEIGVGGDGKRSESTGGKFEHKIEIGGQVYSAEKVETESGTLAYKVKGPTLTVSGEPAQLTVTVTTFSAETSAETHDHALGIKSGMKAGELSASVGRNGAKVGVNALSGEVEGKFGPIKGGVEAGLKIEIGIEFKDGVKVSLPLVSFEVGVNTDYLSHIFEAEVGLPPRMDGYFDDGKQTWYCQAGECSSGSGARIAQ